MILLVFSELSSQILSLLLDRLFRERGFVLIGFNILLTLEAQNSASC